MKKLSELTDFYYKVLYSPLQKLEEDRKALRYRIFLYGSIYTFIYALLLFSIKGLFFHSFEIIAFAGVLYIGIGSFLYKMLIKDYTQEFKAQIIEPLIQEIDSNLSYLPTMHISERLFRNSKLFTSRIDKFEGNDFVTGKIDDVDIQFSDVHAKRKNKNSKGQDNWSTVFQGLFIVADFHKHFKGSTVVLPDTAQNTFGDLVGGWLQSKNVSREELVKMDDPEFEKAFVVYATNQVEARYILTHALMKKLLDFKKRSSHPLHISFVGGSIHIAIENNKDLFEPSVFHSLLDYKIAMEYVKTLHLAIGVIHELKLNQKLWSKQ